MNVLLSVTRRFFIFFLLFMSSLHAQSTMPIAAAPAQAQSRDTVAQLLQWLGVLPALRQIPQVVEMSARGELMNLPSVDAVQITQSLMQPLNSDDFTEQVIDYVSARVDERTLARAKNLLEQSVPVAMRQAEMIMQESAAVAEMNEFHKKLAMQPAVIGRNELIADVNRTMRTSMIAVQIQTGVDEWVNQQLAKKNLVAAAPKALIKQKLTEREEFMQQRAIAMMLFTYKDIRASELRDMKVLMSDNSIQKLLDLSQQGIEVALREINP